MQNYNFESNNLLLGDCKHQLQLIAEGSIDCVYLDPPFYKQRTQKLSDRNNQEYAFDDSWISINIYKEYIKERLEECKKVLKNTGSIFLHCDRTASHHLRILMDEVFGAYNFQSEIIWYYKRWSNSKKGLLNAHQTILFYSKSKEFKFHSIYTNYSPTTNIDQIFQARKKNLNGKTIYKTKLNGEVELLEEKRGVPLSDIWEIPYLNPKAKERVGYPTQKPVVLLENIIKLVTDVGDIVLDPFCGSGTTLVAAKLLGRKYIGIDLSEEAIQITRKRLTNPFKTESKLLKLGKEAYLNQDGNVIEILNAIDAVPVQRNKGIDGFLKLENLMKPIPIRVQKKNEDINDGISLLINACKKGNYINKIFIANTRVELNLNFEENNLYVLNDINEINNIKRYFL